MPFAISNPRILNPHLVSAPAPATRISVHAPTLVVVSGVAILGILTVASVFIGSGGLSPQTVLAALSGDGDPSTVLIINEYRVPRTIIAILVGMALGVAGSLIQATTRNPLADPGILGVNAGAYTAVVFTSAALGPAIGEAHVWGALVGAFVAALIVTTIGTTGPGSGTPAKLVLTGMAFGAVLSGISFAVTLTRPDVFDRVRYWSVGSIQGRGYSDLLAVLAPILIGCLIALMLPRALNALTLGEEAASSLGAHPALTRWTALGAITLLCGAATAAAGPISFVGLLVPHAIRSLTGPNWRVIVPLSLIAGPILVLGADILGRLLTTGELPVGVVTALVGAPVLIVLARRTGTRTQ